MKVSVTTLKFLAVLGSASAFLPSSRTHRQTISTTTSQLLAENAETSVSEASAEPSNSGTKSLGLLTFDLDDTLYPIAQIVEDANGMFLSSNDSGPKYFDHAITLCWMPSGVHLCRLCLKIPETHWKIFHSCLGHFYSCSLPHQFSRFCYSHGALRIRRS